MISHRRSVIAEGYRWMEPESLAAPRALWLDVTGELPASFYPYFQAYRKTFFPEQGNPTDRPKAGRPIINLFFCCLIRLD